MLKNVNVSKGLFLTMEGFSKVFIHTLKQLLSPSYLVGSNFSLCTDLCGSFCTAGTILGKLYYCTLPDQHGVVFLLETHIARNGISFAKAYSTITVKYSVYKVKLNKN